MLAPEKTRLPSSQFADQSSAKWRRHPTPGSAPLVVRQINVHRAVQGRDLEAKTLEEFSDGAAREPAQVRRIHDSAVLIIEASGQQIGPHKPVRHIWY